MKTKNFKKGGQQMTEIEYIEQELGQIMAMTLEMENQVMNLEK